MLTEIEKNLAEASRNIAALAKSAQETDRRIDHLRRDIEDVNKRMKDSDAHRTAEQDKTENVIRRLADQLGGLGNKFGGFTEGMAFPSMDRILRSEFGAQFTTPRAKMSKNGRTLQLDVLAISNGARNAVWIVEVKSRLTKESIDQLLEQLRLFHEFYPDHSGKDLYGILAGVDVDSDVPDLARKKGLYLATIHDELFTLRSAANFTPKSYRHANSAGSNGHKKSQR